MFFELIHWGLMTFQKFGAATWFLFMIPVSRQSPEQEIPESSAKFRNEIQESSGLQSLPEQAALMKRLLFPNPSFRTPNRRK
jgi:hypothetical protein